MREYTIKIWNGKAWHYVDGLRSNIESAALMRALALCASYALPDVTIIVSLFRDDVCLSSFDFEGGICCGQLSIDPELVSNKEIINLYVD